VRVCVVEPHDVPVRLLPPSLQTSPSAFFADATVAPAVDAALAASHVSPPPFRCAFPGRSASVTTSAALQPPSPWVPLERALATRQDAADPLTFPVRPRAPDALVAVLFTSGSTGVPKGAVFPEALAMPTEGVSGIQPFVRFDFQAHDPALVLSLLSTLQCGGARALSVGFDNLLSDLKAARPTNIGATPSFWNMVRSTVSL
jgi:acyl-CoA synthetase (AMP-forming)/AMP-acid ligase II